jgi:hypothetical protein
LVGKEEKKKKKILFTPRYQINRVGAMTRLPMMVACCKENRVQFLMRGRRQSVYRSRKRRAISKQKSKIFIYCTVHTVNRLSLSTSDPLLQLAVGQI